MPLVSVVMAVKNAERFLPEALDSVVAQAVDDIEILVIDGHSTDASVAIASRYPRVRVFAQAGSGFAGAWNEGIAAAQGEWVAFLDSDDRWTPGKLERQLQALRARPDAAAAVGHVRFFLGTGQKVPFGFRPELLEGSHVAFMPGALLARRSLFARVGAFGTQWGVASDIDWFARVKDLGCEVLVLSDVVIEKRVHDSNLSYTAARGRLVRDEVMLLLRDSIRRQRERTGAPIVGRPATDEPA